MVVMVIGVALADRPPLNGVPGPNRTTLPAAPSKVGTTSTYTYTVGGVTQQGTIAYGGNSHVYWDLAEVKYALHDTRLENCKLCHTADDAGVGVNGMNPYGTALIAAFAPTNTLTYGNGAIEVVTHTTIFNALGAIEGADSDGDGSSNASNKFELWALTFPGDNADELAAVPSTLDKSQGALVHGNYGATPDGCARCHRAHTGQAAFILREAQQPLCTTCHGLGGASTNVLDGIQGTDPLRGGGFVNALIDRNIDGALDSAGSSSTHTIDAAAGIMWGWDSPTAGSGKTGVTLECGNCHDPHNPTYEAAAGGTKYTQYRMLQPSPRESGGSMNASGVQIGGEERQPRYFYLAIPDDPGWSTLPSSQSYTQTYMVTTTEGLNNRPDTRYLNDRVGEFCALCHTRYMAGTVVADNNDSRASVVERNARAGDPIFSYQHATREASCSTGSCHNTVTGTPSGGQMPPASPRAFSRPKCLDCHVSHGTNATMGSYSRAVPWPGGAVPGGSGQTAEATNRSSLLRINNRGVCTLCHEF